MPSKRSIVASVVATATLAQAGGSLKDIKHVVIFMQENRAFDHYFGTMAGVRGFADPNVQINPDGRSTFEQPFSETTNGTNILKPFHLNYLGDKYLNSTQCHGAGDNSWDTMHGAYNKGLGNGWVDYDSGYSLGYFKREDIPTHWDIVEGWTLLDMNTQSLLAATDPNRIMWMSGSVNVPGNPTNPDGKGSMILDNQASPGCDTEGKDGGPGINCFPFVWKTFPEYLEEAGVSWQVWQDFDNFEDNMLAYFEQYQTAANGSALRIKGNSYPGLDAFYAAAAKGTLPEISYIIGPQELAEHPPNMPKDGAWLQKQVVDAVTNSPLYNQTALIISYDEQGGWYDHVVPQVPPADTAGEWIPDPYDENGGNLPIGPGPRTPRYIISPWTRGKNVFTQPADHHSDIMFVERWAAAHGYTGVYNKGITPWRRAHMSDLVDAFDFDHPDYSIPHITEPETALRTPDDPSVYSGNFSLGSLTGPWAGPSRCYYDNPDKPPTPYGLDNSNQNLSQIVEQGFKPVRGLLTEGRYLTFETNGMALAAPDNHSVSAAPATNKHEDIRQRWIIHSVQNGIYGNTFHIQSAYNKNYISGPRSGYLNSSIQKAQAFTISYNANGATYNIALADKPNNFLGVKASGHGSSKAHTGTVSYEGTGTQFKIFSVSYL